MHRNFEHENLANTQNLQQKPHMKTYIPALAIASILTACGGGDTSTEPPAPTPALAATPVVEMTLVERGAKIYKRCQACHTLEDNGRNKVGPNLWNVYGAKAGAKEGFAYSKAMRASEIIWTDETMDAYLTRPAKYVPGTKMSFIGLKKQDDRDAVQAYLKDKTTP